LDYAGGFCVELSAPSGVDLAAKTFNPYMGIVVGISIIGTSGIVEPMSSKAILDTIALEMKQRRAEGDSELLLTLGNYSETFLSEYMPDMGRKAVKCSNFIGEAIDMAMEYDFERILLVGHIGKLVKLGAGIMNTHSSQADGRMEVLVTCGVLAGVQPELLRQIPGCVTVDDAISVYMAQDVWQPVFDVLLERIQFHLDRKVKGALPVGAVLFSNKYGMLGRTRTAEKW
ncbi:MAG: cobalt-precorrin-5B (C(1))-methyltransferase CbiD, partial [Lachnospiraceae bacterium]|nr:cobalt-precorrin-5B (C(1))-methyltransferase CbiD [Lachnospiraceae bacterium]